MHNMLPKRTELDKELSVTWKPLINLDMTNMETRWRKLIWLLALNLSLVGRIRWSSFENKIIVFPVIYTLQRVALPSHCVDMILRLSKKIT